MSKELENRVRLLEEKLAAIEHEKLLTTYRRCDGCFEMKPPNKFRGFHVGPCGLTDYFRMEFVCPPCAKKYAKLYKEFVVRTGV